MGPIIAEFAKRSEALLQGRRTYQVSAEAWPTRSGDPFTDWINRTQKYVVSDTLSGSDLTWKPTTIIRGDGLVETVAALVLMIEPITLGGGKTLFPNDGELRNFELVSATTSTTGVQMCRYRPTPYPAGLD